MSKSAEQTLEELRASIDALDDKLAALLEQRIGLVQQVAALKAAHWPGRCHIRSGREGRMHRRIAERFRNSAFPPSAALAIWRQIIGVSTHVESPLSIAAMGERQAQLARDYFGVSAHIEPFMTIEQAINAMATHQCSILLARREMLVAIISALPELKVFAALPLVADGHEPVLALAPLIPESSDDDISYYRNGDTAEAQPGFKISPQWLGAHPRQLTL